jgi:predicted NBD/HSP70 family sugar kinase
MTRAELADVGGVTRAAITRITQELAASGYIEIQPLDLAVRGPGRPVSTVALRSGGHLCVGVELRLDRGRIRAVDLRGDLLAEYDLQIEEADGSGFASALAQRIAAIGRQLDLPVSAVGVSMPISVDPTGRLADSEHNNWSAEPLADHLAEAIGIDVHRVRLGNVSVCAALANWRDVPDASRLAHLQVGLGAGLGVASEGDSEPSWTMGGIGHLPLQLDGPLCRCGRRGCLDALAGFQAFVRAGSPDLDPERARNVDMRGISAAIVDSAENGDRRAQAAIDDSARWIARAAVCVQNLMAPTHITLGGYPSYLGERFQQAFRRHVDAATTRRLHVVDTRWGDDASVQGAALMAVHSVLETPTASTNDGRNL